MKNWFLKKSYFIFLKKEESRLYKMKFGLMEELISWWNRLKCKERFWFPKVWKNKFVKNIDFTRRRKKEFWFSKERKIWFCQEMKGFGFHIKLLKKKFFLMFLQFSGFARIWKFRRRFDLFQHRIHLFLY